MRPRRFGVELLGLTLALGLAISCGGTAATSPLPAPTSPALSPTPAPGSSATPRGTVDMAPFKVRAKSGMCADIRNRLFLIDGRLVLWDRAGNCADAAYAQTLYGSTPDQVLCRSNDSIAGPVKNCQDEGYRDMFDTITANLEKPDLGLGPDHTVQPVQF